MNPTVNVVPDGMFGVRLRTPEESLALGAIHDASTPCCPGRAVKMMLAGQFVITGGKVSAVDRSQTTISKYLLSCTGIRGEYISKEIISYQRPAN